MLVGNMNSGAISRETALKLYKQMVLARLFEEKAALLYMQGHIWGFCHLYIGQEAVAIGIIHNMMPVDSSITSYRDHVQMLTLGVSPNAIMAELCGKSTGCSKGKGGSMHMYSKEHNFYGGNGIVGAQVPLGTGLAFSHKYRKDGGVSVTYFGDGTVNQGQVYEAFNMASLWKLPAVYVIENNHYAMGTSTLRSVAGSIETRGDSFGIPTISVDGMDLFDVIEKSKEAIDRVRGGGGPVILHVDTYRYRGHSMSDPANYRTREEVDCVKRTRDPIIRVKQKLLDEYKMTEGQLSEIEGQISEVVDAAEKFALESPFPDDSELTRGIMI